ncbi:MAG: glycogen synthase [Oscillospiraceae bacterium]|jgi:starch synthase|nr:glycogen synthase [Oscillospiraceae bacterium]
MKILYAASEAQPFAASGGLADVAGSLPKALVKEGHECAVVMPYYKNTIKPEHQKKITFLTSFNVPVGWRAQYCGVFTYDAPDGVKYFFLDNEYYFKRDFGIYGYYDDAERYAFFSRAVLEMLHHVDYKPEIINSNDWQCALIPVYYQIYFKYDSELKNIRNVFTIHNIAYQGQYGMNLLEEILSIPRHMANIVEYDRDINFMKGAIEVADKVTTVSPTYATEILDPWFSHGLDRVLTSKQYKTCGFLNGIDTDMYNPQTDPDIPAKFSVKSKAGKKICKAKLLEEVGLASDSDEPVIGIISRLVEHKGFDLIKQVFDRIVEQGFKVVILGSGDPHYEQFFIDAHRRHPDKVSFTCGYFPPLAKRIYAGSDMFLMPSKSEPCGLAQMISLRYGTVPIVRATGGLKDSIIDCGEKDGTGFTFLNYDAEDMFGATERAFNAYNDRKAWNALVTRAMKADFSWSVSAKLYIGLYEELISWNL